MGDDRAAWKTSDPSLHESDYLEAGSNGVAASPDETGEVEVVQIAEGNRPSTLPRAGASDSTEFLKMRWDTPRGRKVRALVLRDIRTEGSAHLAEILHDLRSAGGLAGYHDLRFARLDGENLSHARLARADLSGASLAKANLVSADLTESRLVKTRLVGATLREADLSRADLTDANLTEANLERATAVSAVLYRARAIGASFRGASLVGADLRCAMLVRATFEETDMLGASVEGAHVLTGVFAATSQKPAGLQLLNELVIGGEPAAAPVTARGPESARIERTRTGSYVLHRLETATDTRRRPTLPVPGLAASTTPAAPATTGATRNWDAALSALLLQRGRVARITVVLDGVEKMIFER